MNRFNRIVKHACLPLVALGVSACSDSDLIEPKIFEVSVVNASASQPLSPIAAVLHRGGYQAWEISGSASAGLELLAEGGDNSELLAEAEASTANYLTGTSSQGVLLPGDSVSLSLSAGQLENTELTLISMLVNTNDAFTGVTGLDLTSLSVGGELQLMLPIYDAGTEFNSELDGTIPGPADGGEGFNVARDDIADQVTRHPGVVSDAANGGLSENPLSTLEEIHKFDAPIAKVVVTRVN